MTEKKTCEDCGGQIGTEHIHKNLHILFAKNPELRSRYVVNTILFKYWKMFNGFGDTFLEPEYLENSQSIDREIRNILPATEKGLAKERDIRYRYGWNKKNQWTP